MATPLKHTGLLRMMATSLACNGFRMAKTTVSCSSVDRCRSDAHDDKLSVLILLQYAMNYNDGGVVSKCGISC